MPPFLRWLLRLGPSNPISVRLVQNGSRRSRHFYIRTAYLAVLIVVLLWSLLLETKAGQLSYRDLANAGAKSFTYIAYLQIGLICLLAPVFMAGAIAQESDPRTWDIQLTTPMTSIEIVLGNLLGRLFFILALLLASLPLFAITQYFGGVPGRAIFGSYLIAGCAAVFVGSVAISLAVSRLVGKRAVFAFYVAVVSYLAVTWAVDYWINTVSPRVGVTWMTAMNPFLCLHAMLNPSTYPRAAPGTYSGIAAWFLEKPVTTFCILSGALSLLMMLASTITVRGGGIQSIGSRGSGVSLVRRAFGLGGAGSEYRAPRQVWNNPIAWREAAARNATLGRMIARWSFIALGGLLGIGVVSLYHGGTLSHDTFRLAMATVVWGELAVIALVAINMSATAVSREREDGTLDLLLTTPITPSAYLKGKLRGLIAYLLPLLAVPLGSLLLASIYVAMGGLGRQGGVEVNDAMLQMSFPVILPEAGIVAAVAVVPFIAMCVMVGLHWSLKSRGTISSVVSTFAVVGVVAGIVGLCGWKAASDLSIVGPVLGALSPASLVWALVYPESAMLSTIKGSGDLTARVSLLVGAFIAAGIYAAFVYGIHAALVRNFDMTVRRLAGVK